MTKKEIIERINAALLAENRDEKLSLLFNEVYSSQDREQLIRYLNDVIIDNDFIINPIQKNLLIQLLEKYNNNI